MYKKLTQAALVLALSIVLLWLSITYLLPISLPFALGAGLALLAEPAVRLLRDRLHLPPALATAISVTGVFCLSATLLLLVLAFLMGQLRHLGGFFPQIEQTMAQAVAALRDFLLNLAPRMPDSIHHLLDHWAKDLLSDSSSLLSEFASRLPQMATGLLSNLSEGLFGLVTGIISGYMLSVRLPRLRQWVRQRLPQRWRQQYLPAIAGLKRALGGWLLSEVKLAAIAFVLLLVGFFVLQVKPAIPLAALITLVDAFPVLGVGTVLLPWAALRLIQQDYALGFGVLALYIIIWLVRSILEPKLLGKELGLDPLLTLVCIYAGFRLWGLAGMLLAPIAPIAFTQAAKQLPR